MLVLGFDFGMKFIGVASGQTITQTATPLMTLKAIDGIPNWDEIAQLIQEWRPEVLLVGLPLNMDGTSQLITHCANKFANRLKQKYKLPVFLVDERLSTWESKQCSPRISNALSQKELLKINATAAAIIVEQWLKDDASN